MLVLASASPRRAELLNAARIPCEVMAVEIDEMARVGETPDGHVRRLAEEKARAAAARRPNAVVLGADTVVVIDGRILGKPRDASEASGMLRLLSGRAHEVLTAIALIRGGSAVEVEVDRTRVWVSPLTEAEIWQYVATTEPLDKAGAYAIQGYASRFIERIEGSYSNVVGLPVALVYRLLQAVS